MSVPSTHNEIKEITGNALSMKVLCVLCPLNADLDVPYYEEL